jgi:hypothetical protein
LRLLLFGYLCKYRRGRECVLCREIVAEDRDFVVGLNRRRLSTAPLRRRTRHNKDSGGLIQQHDMDTVQSGVPNVPPRSLFPDTIPMLNLFPAQVLLFRYFILFLVFLFVSPSKLRGAAYDMVLS